MPPRRARPGRRRAAGGIQRRAPGPAARADRSRDRALGADRAEGSAGYLEDAEEDLIAFYLLPSEHWTKLRSANPLERANKEIGRRTDVVGIFPNDKAVIRLAGILLAEQYDEWLVQRRYLSVESMQLILDAGSSEENSLEQQHHPELAELTTA